jgi:biopolymer transport protein ExbD
VHQDVTPCNGSQRALTSQKPTFARRSPTAPGAATKANPHWNADHDRRELEEKLRTIYEDRRNKTMFIIGDGTLRYGDVVNVIDAAKGAGVQKVGIVTEGMRKGTSAPA